MDKHQIKYYKWWDDGDCEQYIYKFVPISKTVYLLDTSRSWISVGCNIDTKLSIWDGYKELTEEELQWEMIK